MTDLIAALRAREAATDMTAPQYRRDSMNDDTPAARVIDAQRRERLAVERAERAEARVVKLQDLLSDARGIADQRGAEIKRLTSVSEVARLTHVLAWNDEVVKAREADIEDAEARAARAAKRARRWKRRARALEREVVETQREADQAALAYPADFNPAEAFLHTAPDADTRAQPQVEPAATPTADKPELAVYGQSEPRSPTGMTVVRLSCRDGETLLPARVRAPLPPDAWDEPATLAEYVGNTGGRVDG